MIELSLVIPIYKVEDYLEECLKSIYQLDIKKEIILVNDESPDLSYLIIEKYKKLYPEETIVINQKNKGLSGARNSGLSIATGEYIAFIDSDDFILPEEYKKVFMLGKEQELDIIIGTHLKYKDGILNTFQRNEKLKKLKCIKGMEFLKESIKLNSFKEEVWDDIYRTKFLKENNLEFFEKLVHEDVLFSIKALIFAEKVTYFSTPIYMYRQREGSIMSSFSEKNNEHRFFIIEKILEECTEKNYLKIEIKKYVIGIIWEIYKTQKRTNIKILKKILKFNAKTSIKNYIKILIIYLFSNRKMEIKKGEL